MTIEEFLTLKVEQKIYNKEKGIFGIVSHGTRLLNDQDIADAVAERINGVVKNWTVSVRDYLYSGVNWNPYQNNYNTVIPLDEHALWQKIGSINEIENQKLVNTLLMIELRKIKHQLTNPITIQQQHTPTTPPPLISNPIYIEGTLNLE